jgi:hypothetical protein|nr:MAG TPA: hypothetical protein [Crassvirales sp.]
MKLFRYEGYKVVISEEAFALKVFRQIWNRDRSVNKDKAIMELGYVYFMADARSDYQYIVDEDERSKAIIEGEGLPSNWKPDKMIIEAIKFYEGMKSTSALLLEDTRVAIDKVRKFLKEVNLEDTDDKGRPIYTINSITSTIKMIPQLIKDLDDAEKAIKADMQNTSGKVRGQKEKSLLEDGIF